MTIPPRLLPHDRRFLCRDRRHEHSTVKLVGDVAYMECLTCGDEGWTGNQQVIADAGPEVERPSVWRDGNAN